MKSSALYSFGNVSFRFSLSTFVFVVFWALGVMPFSSRVDAQSAGAIPSNFKSEDIQLVVKKFDRSAWSLRIGDKRVRGTDFVLSNWANTSNYAAILGGLLGVQLMDQLSKSDLNEHVETILRNDFDLQYLLLDKLKNNPNLSESVNGIDVLPQVSEYHLILEPYALVYSNEDGVMFNPQILAELEDVNGQVIWSSVYGESSVRKRWGIENDLWNRTSVDTELNKLFELLVLHIAANLDGYDTAYQKERDRMLTDKFMENIERSLPEF